MLKQSTRILLVVCVAVVLTVLASASSAFAETPAWLVRSDVRPMVLAPGVSGEIVVSADNVGDASTDGSPIVITDKFPRGLRVTGSYPGCDVTSSSVRCEYNNRITPPYNHDFGELHLVITVLVEEVSPDAVNVVSISGGGAEKESSDEAVHFGSVPDGFGVEKLEQVALNENGSPDTQAGSHPFQYTTTLELKKHHVISRVGANEVILSGAFPKDLDFNLPPGLVGNPNVVPQCTNEQFSTYVPHTFFGVNECPDDSVVGVAQVTLSGGQTHVIPLFNLVPSVGEPARFGFNYNFVPVFLDTAVRSGGDYGIVVKVSNISDLEEFLGSQVSFWGVPSDPRHDNSRGYKCLTFYTAGQLGPCPTTPPGQKAGAPFLTLPTSCTGPLRSSVEADAWGSTEEIGPKERPGEFQSTEYTWHNPQGPLALDGCNHLPFTPSVSVAPDGQDASTPTGLLVTEHVPQDNTQSPTGLAESTVKNTTVVLPEGVQISPAGGVGLLACSTAQVGFEGANPHGGLEFTDEDVSCPEASKVGTVKITTPLLPDPLTGSAYLAAQNANPFGSLVALYIVVRDPVSGVLVKAAGEVVPDLVTGQLVTTFKNTPQLPYEDLELHFFGSARAPLTTPPLCGVYTTHTSIEGWSGNLPSEPSSSFAITSGPGGGPCSDPQPFAPGFKSGTTNLQAGAFTPFELTMIRPDADQTLSGVELHMPPGLLGTLSNVALCGEPQAAQGTCGPESLIGETTVSAGLGDSPYTVTGGKVYITTGYKGAPYGLSIVNPAKAGPFDLGVVVVRASISVDPHTAALTIKSDPLPTILDGIPLQIQRVNVSVNRDRFTFNPTNCNKTALDATLTSTEGVAAPVSPSFQVTNCERLAFKPKLTASTQSKDNFNDNGASLTVRVVTSQGPNSNQGASTEANIAQVKVELPKALPSRLTTLQKACSAKAFEANPANCPAASIIGYATVHTPVLPVPVTGPAYFVSHGGEAFPSLIMVLQGYGVTIDLVGSTFISHAGITSSTFKTVPDVPFSTFELTLPTGKFSALAANTNVCKPTKTKTFKRQVSERVHGKTVKVTKKVNEQVATPLVMPTSITSQDGAVLTQKTQIVVTGCKKARSKKAAKRKAKGKNRAKK